MRGRRVCQKLFEPCFFADLKGAAGVQYRLHLFRVHLRVSAGDRAQNVERQPGRLQGRRGEGGHGTKVGGLSLLGGP